MLLPMRKLLILLIAATLLHVTHYLFGVVFHNPALKPKYSYWSTDKTLSALPINHKANSQNPIIKDHRTKKVFFINKASNLNTNISNITRVITTEDNKTFVDIQNNNIINMTGPDPAYVSTLLITKIMEGIKNLVTTEGVIKKSKPTLPLCDATPTTDLGPIYVNKTELELDEVERRYPEVHWGGRYSPPNCTARNKVAIIVPYRDRRHHLIIFLNHMHPFLMKQQLEYGIFIIEQTGNRALNRAKLKNVGFVEAQRLKAGGWQCFIFHDIDLLPLDSRNLYSCPRQPRHMSVSIDIHNFKLLYEELFGGVLAMTLDQFTKVNGFSNKYWGWGGEDDDMTYRLQKMNFHIARYKMPITRYMMLDHKKSAPNPKRYRLLSKASKIFQMDGLSTLEYKLVQVTQYHLYTHVIANIDAYYSLRSYIANLLFGNEW